MTGKINALKYLADDNEPEKDKPEKVNENELLGSITKIAESMEKVQEAFISEVNKIHEKYFDTTEPEATEPEAIEPEATEE